MLVNCMQVTNYRGGGGGGVNAHALWGKIEIFRKSEMVF